MLTRIAPTPSGYLHMGNLCNFLLTWLWAKSCKGQVLLRIDDADAERKKEVYVADIFNVLQWLGLQWDKGPSGVEDFEKNWSQQGRMPIYEALLHQLIYTPHLYACTCSRAQLLSSPCSCKQKKLPLTTPGSCYRVDLPANASFSMQDAHLGNIAFPLSATPFVVKKKDGQPAYPICTLADDVYFGITHICRGIDLLPSTAMQFYLAQCTTAGAFTQCSFWHHPLLTHSNGGKLSKSAGHQAISINNQYTKKEIFTTFAQWMKWPAHADTLPALLEIALQKIPLPQEQQKMP
jgi:glutamyl/glutaminyl-tRNA synthetase